MLIEDFLEELDIQVEGGLMSFAETQPTHKHRAICMANHLTKAFYEGRFLTDAGMSFCSVYSAVTGKFIIGCYRQEYVENWRQEMEDLYGGWDAGAD